MLKQLAEELFEKYCEQELGKRGNWQYLSKERQLAWMADAMTIAVSITKKLKAKVKPMPPPPSRFDTMFSHGYYVGQLEQRTEFVQVVHDIYQDLQDEFEDFKASIEKT